MAKKMHGLLRTDMRWAEMPDEVVEEYSRVVDCAEAAHSNYRRQTSSLERL